MNVNIRRVALVLGSLVVTFIVLRIYLQLFPGTNFDVAGYNIHHLYTGLLLLTLGGLPLIFFSDNNCKLDLAAIMFGSGLSMALDEWVYLIATDGSDTSYLLPVSFWGAVIVIGLVLVYAVGIILWAKYFERN